MVVFCKEQKIYYFKTAGVRGTKKISPKFFRGENALCGLRLFPCGNVRLYSKGKQPFFTRMLIKKPIAISYIHVIT